MKTRILSILLALALLCAILPASALPASAATYSGSFGDGLTWSLNTSTGLLEIKGSGPMPSAFDPANAPWRDYADSIKEAEIQSGITMIGDCAFYDCKNLASVSIPTTVTSIGSWAFSQINALKSITIPGNVEEIYDMAFTNCYGLESVTISPGCTKIDQESFAYCTKLKSVTLPDTLTEIGSGAFRNSAITSIEIPSSVTRIWGMAFYGCVNMQSVTIPSTVTEVMVRAFGYYQDLMTHEEGKIPGFLIIADDGSAGAVYAEENGFDLLSKPTIKTQPKSAMVVVGESATFNVVAKGGSLSYQWQYKKAGASSYTDFSGATSSSLTVKGSSTNNGCKYRCVVSNQLGKVTSNSATLTITTVAKPTITAQPKNATVVKGKSAAFTVAATGEGTLTYQWQYKRAGETSWCNWSGRTEPTLTVTGGSNNDSCQYRCAVTNAGGTTYSNAATLTVKYPPTITTHPQDAIVVNGESATFSVTATGEDPLTYQWQYKRAGGTSWSNWSGRTEPTLTVTAGSNNDRCQYRCAVTNAGGTTYSCAATLAVKYPPIITTQPQSVSLALGECMTFTCAATGKGTLYYQWQYKRAGASSWTDWIGKKETILNVLAGSNNNGCQYRCVVSSNSGSVYSDAATLTITSSHECPGAAFTDMPTYGTIEHTAIDWAVRAGVTNGTSNTTFSPSKTVTRGQVVTFLWRACGSPEPKTTKNPFTDVKTTDWFYRAVLWAVEQGITNGTSATKFSPSMVCSRSQILTFLYRQQGSPAVGSVTVPYTDVQAGAFYENAMKWAYANGIDRGTTKTTFSPNVDCIRVSNVVFLYRAITGQGRLK